MSLVSSSSGIYNLRIITPLRSVTELVLHLHHFFKVVDLLRVSGFCTVAGLLDEVFSGNNLIPRKLITPMLHRGKLILIHSSNPLAEVSGFHGFFGPRMLFTDTKKTK